MAKAKKIPLIEDFDNVPAEALVPEEEWPYTIPKHGLVTFVQLIRQNQK